MAPSDVDFGFNPRDPSTWLTAIWRVGVYAVGAGTVAEQIVASSIIIVGGLISTTLTLGATVLVVLLGFFFLGVGFLRIIPQINAIWPLGA
jgi:hypothetical protein